MNDYLKFKRRLAGCLQPYVKAAPFEHHSIPLKDRDYICSKCHVRQPAKNFFDGPKIKEWCLNCRLKHPEPIPDHYIRSLLRINEKKQVQQGLTKIVELKRRSLQLQKFKNLHENHQRHS